MPTTAPTPAAALRAAALATDCPRQLTEIVRDLLELARAGDGAAAKLVYSYVLGQPAPATDPNEEAGAEQDTPAVPTCRAEPERDRPPSPNRPHRTVPPSTNDSDGAPPQLPPSTNGSLKKRAPRVAPREPGIPARPDAHGQKCPCHTGNAPSPIGCCGDGPPSTNGSPKERAPRFVPSGPGVHGRKCPCHAANPPSPIGGLRAGPRAPPSANGSF